MTGIWKNKLLQGMLALLCLWPCIATAAHVVAHVVVEKPISAFYRETWTTRQGLPHNQVMSIAQTPDGYLWLGTWEGLVRYNGLEFQVFDRSNTPALRGNGIRSLRVAQDGALVIGTARNGVAIKRGDAWQTFGKAEGLAQDEVMSALEDQRGRLWVATENMGLTLLDHGKVTQFNLGNGQLPSNVVFSMLEDRDGSLWAGTANGLVHFVEGKPTILTAAQGLPAAPLFNLLQRRQGQLLVASERGVFRRIGHSVHFERLSSQLPEDGVPSLAEDAAGNLWIGTVNNGLFRLSPAGVEHFTSRRELPNNRIPALFVDREDSVWVGTNAGLMRLSDAPFTTWNSDQGMSDDYVRALALAPDGGIWIGTGRGLNLWQGNEIKAQYSRADGLPGDSILSLLPARDGSLLVGTDTNGVLRLRNGKVIEQHDNAHGMPGSNQVRALADDGAGTVWIGTTRGLVRLRDKQYRLFDRAQGLPRDFIIALHQTRDGALWVGTSNGAARILGDRVQPLDLNQAGHAQDVFGFHEDADGTLWMVTDRGLLRYRNGQLRSLGLKEGLPADTLFALIDDGLGYFWLTSNRGVLRVARKDVDAVLDGSHKQLPFDHFGEADGLVSAQCNGGSGPAAMLDRRGNIWVATARGAAAIDPAALHIYRHTLPKVVLEQVLADGKPVPIRATLQLPAGTRKLEFRYAAISFLMPRFLRYRYRLNGFDPGWVDRGNRNTAQFTNLEPGNYRFDMNVSAPSLGQDWSSNIASVQITIAPQFWQRRSVQAATVLLVAMLFYILFLWRVGNLRRRAGRLEAMVDQRTRDLREHTDRLRASDQEKSALLARLREQSEAFERMALEDALTGIGNRRSLDSLLDAAFTRTLRGERALCFALFDIDQFKQINDRYSHAAGDQALVAVAHALRDALGGAGVLARWGGEEFAVLFERVPLARAQEICNAMRLAVEALDCSAYVPGWQLTISGGVAAREDTARPEDLVARADALLYQAKQGGRNRVCS